MWKSFKKVAARKSAKQISRSTLRLIEAMVPYEEQLLQLRSSSFAGDPIAAAVASSNKDRSVTSALGSLSHEANGPIPISIVKEDIFKVFLSQKVPIHYSGDVLKVAFRQVLKQQKDSPVLDDMEEIWAEIKRTLTEGNDNLNLADYVDDRFQDL